MQDYIFNSRRQAARRRQNLIVKLLVVLFLGAGGYYGYQYFIANDKAGDATPANGDILPLPPVNDTLPAQSRRGDDTPAEASMALTTPTHPPQASSATPPEEITQNTAAVGLSSRKPKQADMEPQVQLDAEIPVEDPLPAKQILAKNDGTATQNTSLTREIKSGDTLASIFKELDIPYSVLLEIINSNAEAKQLSKIRKGQILKFELDPEGKLQSLTFKKSRIETLKVTLSNEKYDVELKRTPLVTRTVKASGAVTDNLWDSAKEAGLTANQLMQLVKMFGWQIDFAQDVRQGDQFYAIYEQDYLPNGEKYGSGNLLAAEYINKGKVYKAIRYTNEAGLTAYYDEKGNAKKGLFLRTPVEFTRISSRFTRKRWHPVLKKWRSHKGVDYAARRGTPVHATGDGKITFIGRKGGYGKVVYIHHAGKYTTVYGHLNGFARGMKQGKKVKQGQVIGYVGSTGLATGPHLHYEFRVHGKHQNPLTVKLPQTIRLPKKELKRFKRTTQPLLAELDELRATTMVASASSR